MLLRIESVTLQNNAGTPTAPFVGVTYFPRYPGGDQDTVTETIQAFFNGSTSTLVSLVNDIENDLDRAGDPGEDPIYLEYRAGDSGTIWRSPIVGGRVVWSDDIRERSIAATTATGQLSIIVERRAYWEGAESTIGSGTVKNGTASPYNALTLSTISGTLPAPISVNIDNANGSINTRNFYLNIDNQVGLTTNQQFLTSSTTVGALKIFSVSSSVLGKFAGQDAQIIAGIASASVSQYYMYSALYTTIGGVYQELMRGKERYVNGGELVELGSLALPPGGNANADFAVAVGVYPTSVTYTMSFVHIAQARHALHLIQPAYTLSSTAAIQEDGTNETAWMENGGSTYELIRRSGGPLMVYPGKTPRLHLLWDTTAGLVTTESMSLTVTYRPRRKTI